MKSLFLVILTVFSFSLFAQYEFSYADKTFSIIAKSLVKNTEDTKLVFTTDAQGKITFLHRNAWPFITEYFPDEEDARDNVGFYDVVPSEYFSGSCMENYCRIQIVFCDEDITTLYIHFDSLYQYEYHKNPQFSGKMFETRSDQGMTFTSYSAFIFGSVE